MHEGIPHNSYYPGDGATMTKNGGKGGAKLNPAALEQCLWIGLQTILC